MASKKAPPADEAAPLTGPALVPDAGALFQKDRSGDPRIAQDTEGKVNFASFAEQIVRDHTPPEAA